MGRPPVLIQLWVTCPQWCLLGSRAVLRGGSWPFHPVLLKPRGSVWLCRVVLVVLVYHVLSIALFLLCCMFWLVLGPSIPYY